MELWYRQLGFYNNPFSIKPAMYHDKIFGNEMKIEEVVRKIGEGGIIFVEGDYGSGKSTLLKRIIHAYGGRKEVIYYSCNTTENRIDLDGLVKGRKGFLSRMLFSGDEEELILLLDEAQEINEEDAEEAAKKHKEKKFKTIVLVVKDMKKTNNLEELKRIAGKDNIIKMGKLNEEDAIKIIRKRIGQTRLISDDMIKAILKKSENNPRKLLKNCEEVCKYAVENIEDEVKETHVKKVLGA